MVNEETILVKIVNKVVGEGELIKEKNLISEVRKANGDITKTYEEQTNSQRKRVAVTKVATEGQRDMYQVSKETLAQGPRFKMHYLGIMFGGMALNRAMSNLTATSKEWVGIGELMSTTMGVVMLPATLTLLETAVLPLMNALLGMPEWVQTTVGVTVMGLEGLGKVLETGGQIALGAASFSILYGQIAKNFGLNLAKAIALNIGKGILVSVGLIIVWQSIKFQREAIEEGSLIKEIMSIIGIGTGLGLVGLALGGPIGGLIGFTLGVSIGLVISWFIKKGGVAEGLKSIGDFSKGIGGDIVGMFGGRQMQVAGIAAGFIGERLSNGNSPSNTNSYTSELSQGFSSADSTMNRSGDINIVNNIKVDDKNEFLRMIKQNNQAIIREVRKS